ncbi:MAG: imidazole glycerol phosphate synthase subunit HisH [Bacteroidota bacterium]
MRIVIIDYHINNLRSVQKAFAAVGYPASVSDQRSDVESADLLVLPGVGSFGVAMENLRRLDLVKPIINHIRAGNFLLGICLGLQLLFKNSEESGESSGLGIFSATVKRFPEGVKVPHIGWNSVEKLNQSKLLAGIPDNSYFYFVHSYYVEPNGATAGRTTYGTEFTSVLEWENVFAVQFHPEKSQSVGLRLLKNFAELI